ncbi:hypothetical protein [Pseudolysinimonas yzui]|uniref:Uncharacterized protein n=1 Tax=Pseudolysinimonas yzui TaxID=2708254 RepID=A0A8J3GPL9_9MICO|nr:hypothetical protein [Pseudolysinimonas yzui]GHF12543.1 hypothetical protein GCM10011600_11650 [Pseudolysinimonas yzui]
MADRFRDDTDLEYFLPTPIWPPALKQPARPPALVHLDTAQWIRFARVLRGDELPAYASLLEALREAVGDGRARIAMSGSQYREIIKVKDPAKRGKLAAVVEELTDFTYITSHLDVVKLELQASLDAITGTTGHNWMPIDLIGTSALNVMGRVGGLKIQEGDEDITERLLAEDPTWAERIADMNRQAERMLLSGPSDEEAAEMRPEGYEPEASEQMMIDNAILEEAWARQIDKYRATHRVRDLVLWRHLHLELLDMIVREQLVRGIRVDDIFSDPVGGARFVLGMPSSAVTVSMKAQYHQDPSRRWTANDLYDFDALALSIPYCDVVFADASARDAAIRRGLDRHFGTRMPRRPEDLTALLRGLASVEPSRKPEPGQSPLLE